MSKRPAIVPLILEQVRQETEDTWIAPPREGSFWPSEMGKCPRAVQYRLLKFKGEDFSPEVTMIFMDGNLHHDSVRTLIKRAGMRLTNEEFRVYKEYEREVDKEKIKFGISGKIDGLINGKYPVDIKSASPWSYKSVNQENILKARPGYVLQVQFYLDIMDKEEGVLILKDKGNAALKPIWVLRDKELLELELQRLAKIQWGCLHARMIKRPFQRNSFECRGCPMRIHCWEEPMEQRPWK